MKKYLPFLSIAITILGCVSCNNQDNEYNDNMTSCPIDSLHSEILNNSFILAKPTAIFVCDSTLIVTDSHCGDNLFYTFRATDGSFLKGGGKKGEAPGEVLNPEKVHINNQGILSYWDIYKRKFIHYDIHAFLKDSTQYFSESTLEYKQAKNIQILDAIKTRNGSIYNGNSEQNIGIYPANRYLDAPSLPGVSSKELCRAVMNRGHLEVSPDCKHAIRATPIGGIVQCFDIDNQTVREKWLKLFFPPIFKLAKGAKPAWITWKPETQMGFEDLQATDQAAYLLLNGKFAKDEPYANEVLVIDWDGNVTKKYVLDQTVKSIAVNETQNVLYAITCGFDVEPNIVRFSIS